MEQGSSAHSKPQKREGNAHESAQYRLFFDASNPTSLLVSSSASGALITRNFY